MANNDNKTLTAVLEQLVNNNKCDNERIAIQEANYYHLTKTIENMAISSAASLKELTMKTGELALTIERIAINEQHIEDRILKEMTTFKDELLQVRSEAFSAREKIELSIRDHSHRITTLERAESVKEGEENIHVKSRTFWNANGIKFVILACMAVPVLAALYALIKAS